jgi:hypothetical protein
LQPTWLDRIAAISSELVSSGAAARAGEHATGDAGADQTLPVRLPAGRPVKRLS